MNRNLKRLICGVATILMYCNGAMAADAAGAGAKGLESASGAVKGYFDGACKLFYAICAVMALVGAYHCYSKFQSSDPDTSKTIAGWAGGLIFAVIAITVIKNFFAGSI